MEKVIKDGMVAILYSPGYGAGWSSWTHYPECIFDPETVEWVMNYKRESPPNWKEKFGEDFYDGGALGLTVMWLPIGTMFRINEYDGSETIEICGEEEWVIA